MTDEISKILPIVGGGSGGTADALLPMMAGMMSKCGDKDGFGGGSGLWVILLFAFLLFGGCGGRGAFGAGAVPADAAASSLSQQNFMTILGELGKLGTAIAASTATTGQNIDTAIARSQASNELMFSNTNANIQETKAGLCKLSDRMSDEARASAAALTNSTASILQSQNVGFNGVEKAVNCGFNSTLAQMANGFNLQQNLSNQQFNATSMQAAQNFANISNQTNAINCNVTNGTEKILCAVENSKQATLDAIAMAQKDALLAAKDARIAELERAQNHSNIDISIGNRINAAFDSFNRMHLGYGGGNGAVATK